MSEWLVRALLTGKGTLSMLMCRLLGCAGLCLARMVQTMAVDVGAFALFGRVFSGAREVMRRPGSAKIKPLLQDRSILLDSLTGLPNREALHQKVQEEWQRERRPAEPTAMLLIEVDALSRQQRTQDRAIFALTMQTVGGALRRVLPRRTDLLVRYDHATFGAVLPGTDLPGSLRVAARLRWAVLRVSLENPTLQIGPLTVSIGVAVQRGRMNGSSTTLVRAAEGTLQRARQESPDGLAYALIEGRDQLQRETLPTRRLPAWQNRPESPERSLQLAQAQESVRVVDRS